MHQVPELNKKELRDFGLITGAIFVILFGLLIPWLRNHPFPQWPWIPASMLWFLAILTPSSLRPVYKVWMRIGLVLGWINTRIILGIVFYGLVLPMGIIMRLVGRDPMARDFDLDLGTYRLTCQSKLRTSMEKPY